MTAVTMSVTLALVLDGIAMSTKTPTSLKKALSYRAVEILLIEKRRSDDPDFRGCRKVDQVDQESFVTFGPDRRELAEEVPEGVPKMKSVRVAEAVLQMKSPFVQRCSGEEGVDEVVPKMKSPFVEKRSSGEGVVHDEKIPVHEKQEDCSARQELKSKHDKKFKVKDVKAETQETIKNAKLKMEHVKIEEHDAHEIEFDFGVVVKDSSSQICSISEMLNNKQNLQVEHDNLIQ